MKILMVAMLTLSAVAVQPAVAGPWRDVGGGWLFDVQMQRQRPGGFQQRQPPRDFRREVPPERGQRGDGRLTDEERRDLHRDLDRANREIYKGQR